jgi:hypothetical protein
MPLELESGRGEALRLRGAAEQSLSTLAQGPSATHNPAQALTREALGVIGGGITEELFGRRRMGSTAAKAWHRQSELRMVQQRRQSERSGALGLLCQAEGLIAGLEGAIDSRTISSLRTEVTKGRSAQRGSTILSSVIRICTRVERYHPRPVRASPSSEASDSSTNLRRLEQGLRRIIEVNLARRTTNWWVECVPGQVRRSAERRMERREKQYPWLTEGSANALDFLDFSDYSRIITDSMNWEASFRSTFGDSEWIRVKLRELEPIRNDLAHSRIVTSQGKDKLRLYTSEILALRSD